jgi:hypothetical protein
MKAAAFYSTATLFVNCFFSPEAPPDNPASDLIAIVPSPVEFHLKTRLSRDNRRSGL